MPTLWIVQLSPPACAVRILGDILGVKFDIIKLDFTKQEHKAPEFLKINPVGAVPFLKDGNFYLSDSHAILKYILDKYGSEKLRESLYPRDLSTRALVDQALFFDTGVFFNKFKDVFLALKATKVSSVQELEKPTELQSLTRPSPKQKADIEDGYAIVEVYLGNKEYIVSDHLTLADISLGVTTASLQTLHKLDNDKFPRAVAWLGRLNRIPVFENNMRIVLELLTKSLQ